MLRTNIPYLSKFIIGLLLLVCFTVKTVQGNEGPTLLKKSDKKEKLREEDLVTKEVDIKDLVILKYINLDLVKSIFPEATRFGDVDEKTLSIPIFN